MLKTKYIILMTVVPCTGTGQDGEIKAGAWPAPRFTVSGDGVSDSLTGLMWSKNANLPGRLGGQRRELYY